MPAHVVRPGIFSVGAQHWDRRLFDELIPLPHGTSYNAYLIRGSEKAALIDTVDPSKSHVLMNNLESLGLDKIDYIVANHAEQDHSGAIPDVLTAYPDAEVVTNEKCASFLQDLLHIPDDRFAVVSDGEELSLGDRTLEFMMTPWVHWPETMLTYLQEDGVLFTCDLFGSHMASSDLFVRNHSEVYTAAKRYYAEIMMPFRNNIKRHLERIAGMDVNFVAPSHGPIYDSPEFIINAYRDWVSDRVKNEVVVAYVSMHGSTEIMIDHLIDALARRGLTLMVFNLTSVDIGELAMRLVDAATLIIATPTVLNGPHPLAVYTAYLVNCLRPKLRYVAIINSFGWAGHAVEDLKNMIPNIRAQILDPVTIRGLPKAEDFKDLERLADEIYSKHMEDELIVR